MIICNSIEPKGHKFAKNMASTSPTFISNFNSFLPQHKSYHLIEKGITRNVVAIAMQLMIMLCADGVITK